MIRHKTYTVLLLGLLAFSLLAVAAFNWLINPYGIFSAPVIKGVNDSKNYHNLRLTKTYLVEQQEYAGIILGASRGERGLTALHGGWGDLRAYNMSMPGGSIYEAFRNLQHAHAAHPLKVVVLCLDFIAFGAYREVVDTFRERRFLVDIEGHPNSDRMVIRDRINVLLSRDALDDSIQNYKASKAGSPSSHDDFGQASAVQKRSAVINQGGHRLSFHDVEKDYMKKKGAYLTSPAYTYEFLNKEQDFSTIEIFSRILRFAHEQGIELKLFISPAHARLLVAIHTIGIWGKYEQWKKQLVAVNERIAAMFNKPAFTLWDFGIVNRYTTEPVPQVGDTETEMKWFWEGSHFKKELGDCVLDVLFANASGSRWVEEGIAVAINSDNLATHLKAQYNALAQYAVDYPEDVREVCDLAKKLNVFKQCLINYD